MLLFTMMDYLRGSVFLHSIIAKKKVPIEDFRKMNREETMRPGHYTRMIPCILAITIVDIIYLSRLSSI